MFTVATKLPDELKSKFDAQCRKRNLTRSAYLRLLVEDDLEPGVKHAMPPTKVPERLRDPRMLAKQAALNDSKKRGKKHV